MEMSIRAFTLREFCSRYGISRSTAFRELRAGRLVARKPRRNLLVMVEDAEAWANALPVRTTPVRKAA